MTKTVRSLVEVEEEPRWRTDTFVWATLNVDTPTLVSRVETTLDGRWSWRTVDGQATENREELLGDGERRTTVTLPDGSQVISEYEAGQQVKVERYDGETLLSRQEKAARLPDYSHHEFELRRGAQCGEAHGRRSRAAGSHEATRGSKELASRASACKSLAFGPCFFLPLVASCASLATARQLAPALAFDPDSATAPESRFQPYGCHAHPWQTRWMPARFASTISAMPQVKRDSAAHGWLHLGRLVAS